ncbi:TolB-like translocation protein [Algoriphagus resistens]|uniref:hypothetical protein n=1 Tax=Algoriphagus resistens TaxID=1750590 RepID=UPI000716878B|nr:hypothetical protein [Algoriphagus resistens]
MSTQFSAWERLLARSLSAFPQAKNKIKKVYQRINYTIHKKGYRYRSDYQVNELAENQGETFFGYYDKSPESKDGNFILYHYSEYSTKKIPSSSHPIEVRLWDITKGACVYKRKVKSYNWQQGARLQWLSATKFIFNDFSAEAGYHAIVVDYSLGDFSETTIELPVYDCYNDDYALSLDFPKLHELRPDYGYRNHGGQSGDAHLMKKEGIYRVDFGTKTYQTILNLSDLSKDEFNSSSFELKSVSLGAQKINHIMISPDGARFVFLHRLYINGRRFDRLFVADQYGDNVKLVADDQMVSHYSWIDSEQLVVYMRVLGEGDRYYIVHVVTGEVFPLGETVQRYGDGHPSTLGEMMITDTYPNKGRMKELLLYNLNQDMLVSLGEFFESLEFYGETRCDLHPRFSRDGKKIYFDSVHSGSRKLHWINLYG